MSTEQRNSDVLVVGAGLAGMAAGMHLAEMGHRVTLLESGPAIGGSMHLLDHTFPTNSCGLCLMLPRQPSYCPTFECELEERVTLLPYAELAGVRGEGGAFVARVRHKARYVDAAKCDGCGLCAAVCPERRPHDLEGWGSAVKAIYRPAGQRVVPAGWVIDMEYCTRCGACVAACPRGAIDLGMEAREEELEFGAVLLAPGYAAFDARRKGEYGYGVYRNVVTALEFERLVSLAGSRGGKLVRPSDGRAPERVGFVQCVGSRDLQAGAGHCSSVCCMYTAKQVALAKERAPGVEATVYYMDLRGMGKGYEEYLEGVKGLPGVRYVRAMPSRVQERQRTGELVVTVVGEDGKLREEEQDLLVLAVGFGTPAGMGAVARGLGVVLNEYGFAAGDGVHAARTEVEGVFVAGAFREPKDIPETVVEATAAAGEVAQYLRGVGGVGPDGGRGGRAEGVLRDVADEEPRVGVFVCECNGALAPIDVGEVVSRARGLSGVAVASRVAEGCTAEGRQAIQALIVEEKLNRVVVGGCSPRLFGRELEEMMERVGLDARLLARVSLREQVVWPHTHVGTEGGSILTHKAHSLIGMAVAGLKALSGLESYGPVAGQGLVRRAVVVGGGAAGMSAALALSGLGVGVDLVERQAELGGQWREIRYQADGSDPQAALAEMVARVEGDPGIRVHRGAELREVGGKPGSYRSLIGQDGQSEVVEHGVLIVATGGKAAATGEYLYGRHPAVITQRELEQRLSALESPPSDLQTVVMIQCVGSREPERPYCSRVCCTQAVKNALKLKEVAPGCRVYVLYREVRTYGFRERYYQAAREAGVVFLRYELEEKPRVRANGERVEVELRERVAGLEVKLEADLLVLSVGVEAEESGDLARTLGVKLDGDGFFAEEHAKMKPLDLGKAGIYAAGLAHGPGFVEDVIVQGAGAAMRAAVWLAGGETEERPTSVWVNERLCSFCGLCVEACPFGARVMNYDRRVAEVDYGLCQGCGVCAVVCPNKATKQKAFEQVQLMATVDMALA